MVSTPSPVIPRPVQEVLARLRWPATLDARGLSAWGGMRDGDGARVDAWVRWNGAEVEARATRTLPDTPDQVLVAHWSVSEAGHARFDAARDNAGPLTEDRLWQDWERALGGLPSPMFVATPRRPMRP